MISEIDLFSIRYLQHGSLRQKSAYEAIVALDLFQRLEGGLMGQAVSSRICLVGDLPTGFLSPTAEIEFAVHWENLTELSDFFRGKFQELPGFVQERRITYEGVVLSTKFYFRGEGFVFLSQDCPLPLRRSVGVLLGLVRILKIGGRQLEDLLVKEKQANENLSETFGRVFSVADPNLILMELDELSDQEIGQRFGL